MSASTPWPDPPPRPPDAVVASVARSLDADPVLFDLLPELLADLDELGSSVDDVLAALEPLALPSGTRALEIGCGKGVVAVALAERLGWDVLGLDALQLFVDDAAARAATRDVSGRCRFRCADARTIADPQEPPAGLDRNDPFDVVLSIAVGDLLGDLGEQVRVLRSWTRPGGYLVIDDGFLMPGSRADELPGYTSYAEHDETLRRLTSHGDTIVSEKLPPPDVTDAVNDAITLAVLRRAERLARRHPDRARELEAYVEAQAVESARLTTDLQCALWVVRRADDRGAAPGHRRGRGA